MPRVRFVQFIPPDGRRQDLFIDRDPSIANLAEALWAKNCSLSIERLSTGEFCLEVDDDDSDEVLAIELADPGEDIQPIVDRIVIEAARRRGIAPIVIANDHGGACSCGACVMKRSAS